MMATETSTYFVAIHDAIPNGIKAMLKAASVHLRFEEDEDQNAQNGDIFLVRASRIDVSGMYFEMDAHDRESDSQLPVKLPHSYIAGVFGDELKAPIGFSMKK
jgi:hypothetical protein